MKTLIVSAALLSLLLMPPVVAQEIQIHRVSASGEIPVSAAKQESFALTDQGDAMLSAGDCQAAEQTFRAALAAAEPGNLGWNPTAERGLAEALVAQGETEEALQLYRKVTRHYDDRATSVAQESRTLMRFAILLSQVNQWPEAVSFYEKALPKSAFGDAPKMDEHFDPQVPMPTELQAMAHVAIGIEYTGHNANKDAFAEFEKGAHLAPDSALANYYYGYGWQHLALKGQTRAALAPQAKAAFQKAANLGGGDVKKNAEESLKAFAPPR